MSVTAIAVTSSPIHPPIVRAPAGSHHQEFTRLEVERALSGLGDVSDAPDDDIRNLANVLHHMSLHGLTRIDNEQLDLRSLTLLTSTRSAP